MIQMIYMGIFMQKFLEKFKRKPLLFLLPSASVLLLLFLLFFHSQQDADQAFSKYTSELFRQEISGNTITLHYTLKNPEKYGIENAPISYGQCTTDLNWSGLVSMRNGPDFAPITEHLFPKTTVSPMMCWITI